MFSELTSQHYTDPAIFDQEQVRVFGKLWVFAGVRTLLEESDQFLTRTIAGIPIVIQNMSGTLKAFENQCAHRQMPLQFEEYGQRRLACRYHGWTYDADGCAKTIPDEQRLYQFSPQARASLCLREFALEVIGNLVFINVDPCPMPIEQQFTAEFRAALENISGHFSSQAIHARIPVSYNWKLNFENVLDSNHVPYVHPRTFQPLIKAQVDGDVSLPAATSVDDTALSNLSYMSTTPMTLPAWPWHDMVNRFGDTDLYYNYFIYPNVNFISLGGLIFLIQQFDPVSPDRSEVRFTLMTASETQRIGALPTILWGHMKGEKRVLDEDCVLLEALQARLHAGGRRAFHGAYETQLRRVAEVYLRLMDDAT